MITHPTVFEIVKQGWHDHPEWTVQMHIDHLENDLRFDLDTDPPFNVIMRALRADKYAVVARWLQTFRDNSFLAGER